MAVQTRTIKRRIKSVSNTRKITKAMELVAASKMRKAVQSVLGTRPYAKLAWETIRAISEKIDTASHPLLRKNEKTTRVLLLLISSDRGLAGGFNVNIIRKTRKMIQNLGEHVEVDAISVGKRGADALKRMNVPIKASFTDMATKPTFNDMLPVSRMIIDAYSTSMYDQVLIAYTDYESAIRQEPQLYQLLPLEQDQNDLGHVEGETEESLSAPASEYVFEPSPEEVLDQILPKLVETMVYQAVLESTASEHSARMMAMRNASDNASDMIDELTFTFNQARQAGITQEIAEISSGKAALEG